METQKQPSTFSLPRSPDRERDVTAYVPNVPPQMEDSQSTDADINTVSGPHSVVPDVTDPELR